MMSAERVFLEKGVESATIEEIARGADVSKGAFYLHFSSKADVIEALRAHFVQGLLDRIAAAVVGRHADNWLERLTAWAQSCAAGYLDASRVHHLVFTSAPPPSREGLTRNVLIDDLTALLAGGNRGNAWSVEDPHFTAVFLFNALHGVVNREDVAGSADDRRKLLCDIDVHFRRAVGAPETSTDRHRSG